MQDFDRNTDRWISAVVQLKPASERAPEDAYEKGSAPKLDIPEGVNVATARDEQPKEMRVPVAVAQVARTKQVLANSGFEVHAPVGGSFSIGGKKSHFERFFETTLEIDEDQLGCPVSVEGGGRQLSLDTLPEEFRALIQDISFVQAVQIPGLPLT